MAIVNIQANPDVAIAGTRDADAVLITSDIAAKTGARPGAAGGGVPANVLVNYQIENIATQAVVNINSNGTGSEGGNVVDVNATTLKIILDFRTDYRVRTKSQFDVDWGAWVNFTTRDKRYQSPHAITQLTDDTDSTAQTQGFKNPGDGGPLVAQGGSRTIVVTNSAKATETDDAAAAYNTSRNWGNTTVINADTIFGSGQLQPTGRVRLQDNSEIFVQAPVAFTDRGATVVNVPEGVNAPIVFTNRGATVTTIRS